MRCDTIRTVSRPLFEFMARSKQSRIDIFVPASPKLRLDYLAALGELPWPLEGWLKTDAHKPECSQLRSRIACMFDPRLDLLAALKVAADLDLPAFESQRDTATGLVLSMLSILGMNHHKATERNTGEIDVVSVSVPHRKRSSNAWEP